MEPAIDADSEAHNRKPDRECLVCKRSFIGRTARDRLVRHLREEGRSGASNAEAHQVAHADMCKRVRGRTTTGSWRQRKWYAAHRQDLLTLVPARAREIRSRAMEELVREWRASNPRPVPPTPPDWNALEISHSNPFYFAEQELGIYVGDTVGDMGMVSIGEVLRAGQAAGHPGAEGALGEASALSSLPCAAEAYFRWKKAKIDAEGWEASHEGYKVSLMRWEAQSKLARPHGTTERDISQELEIQETEMRCNLPVQRRRMQPPFFMPREARETGEAYKAYEARKAHGGNSC